MRSAMARQGQSVRSAMAPQDREPRRSAASPAVACSATTAPTERAPRAGQRSESRGAGGGDSTIVKDRAPSRELAARGWIDTGRWGTWHAGKCSCARRRARFGGRWIFGTGRR